MISQLTKSEIRRTFLKSFGITIFAFFFVVCIQLGYFMPYFEPKLLFMPIVISLFCATLIGWNAVLRKKLEHTNLLKNEFISSVSHELRNPLTIINGYSNMLSVAKDLPEDKQKYAKTIYDAGEYLKSIILDLQDISSIESAKMKISVENLTLSNEIQFAQNTLELLADEHGIKINVHPFSSALGILADQVRLQQVLINLISNAIKYGNDNSNIDIKTEELDNMVCVSIIDKGQGVSKDKLSQLFVPFNRAGAEKSEIKGTGIGLALTKRLIEMMNGEIGVNSEVNKGSQFWFKLPIAKEDI